VLGQSRRLLFDQCTLNTYTDARYQVEFGTDRGDKLRISGMPYASKIEAYGVETLDGLVILAESITSSQLSILWM
jgi:hypothetical protein